MMCARTRIAQRSTTIAQRLAVDVRATRQKRRPIARDQTTSFGCRHADTPRVTAAEVRSHSPFCLCCVCQCWHRLRCGMSADRKRDRRVCCMRRRHLVCRRRQRTCSTRERIHVTCVCMLSLCLCAAALRPSPLATRLATFALDSRTRWRRRR